jgi:hypothetical protein
VGGTFPKLFWHRHRNLFATWVYQTSHNSIKEEVEEGTSQNMSFQYDQFQSPGAQDGNSAPSAPNPQDGAMSGQPTDQPQAPFQGPPGGQGAPGSGPQSGEKTTLW